MKKYVIEVYLPHEGDFSFDNSNNEILCLETTDNYHHAKVSFNDDNNLLNGISNYLDTLLISFRVNADNVRLLTTVLQQFYADVIQVKKYLFNTTDEMNKDNFKKYFEVLKPFKSGAYITVHVEQDNPVKRYPLHPELGK